MGLLLPHYTATDKLIRVFARKCETKHRAFGTYSVEHPGICNVFELPAAKHEVFDGVVG